MASGAELLVAATTRRHGMCGACDDAGERPGTNRGESTSRGADISLCDAMQGTAIENLEGAVMDRNEAFVCHAPEFACH